MSDYDKQIAEIYREMELDLIRNMKRNLGLHLAEEKEAGVKYPQWQAIKLKEMKRYERQNLDIIRRSTARIPKDVSAHTQDEFRQGSSHEIKKHKKVNKALGISSEPVKDSFFRTDARKVTSMIDDVNNSLRTANTAVFRMTNDAYREVVFKYSMFVSNGVYTEKQAYDAAVKSFLERGINCIEYKDGRRVNIADYAQMAVRTANQRAYMTGQGEFRKKLGRTLIRISQHSTSCKLCRPFERQVLIDDVFSGGTQADGNYMLLSEAMAKGLYHPRCRHGSATYFPELDDKTDEKPIKDNSAAKAEKAHAENMVQKYKRLFEGSLCPENVERYRAKLEEWTEKAENISKEVENSEESDIISAETEYSPRKNKDGDFAVNWEAVNSDDYSAKFRKITSNEKVASAIETRTKWALYNRDLKHTEELYAISLKDGHEIARIVNQNSISAVKRTKAFTRKLNEADQNGEEILLIHNHPKGLPPSVADLNALMRNKNISGITAGHNGSVYYYTKPKHEIKKRDFDVILKHFNKYSEETAIMKALECLSIDKKFSIIEL